MIESNGLKESDLYDGKVALVTSDSGIKAGETFKMNVETDDCTSYYYWVEIWRGHHYNYEYLKGKDCTELLKYKAVILQGEYLEDLVKIARFLKGKVVTMLWPEYVLGNTFQSSFTKEEYEAWKEVDVIMNWEEHTGSCYTTLSGTPSHFVYVPVREAMAAGEFLVAPENKTDEFVVYGDNNPTNPAFAIGVAKRLGKSIITVKIDELIRESIKKLFEVNISGIFYKLPTYPYLRLLGKSKVHVYPNSRLGTNREQVSCACVGTPCIGNALSHTQKRLFPKLGCDVRDMDTMVDLAKKLFEDKEFYKEIVEYAWKGVQFYNLENTKRRFMEAYTIGKAHAGI